MRTRESHSPGHQPGAGLSRDTYDAGPSLHLSFHPGVLLAMRVTGLQRGGDWKLHDLLRPRLKVAQAAFPCSKQQRRSAQTQRGDGGLDGGVKVTLQKDVDPGDVNQGTGRALL